MNEDKRVRVEFELNIPVNIMVPDDYTDIQEAVDAAVDGDTVTVSPGTYYLNRMPSVGPEGIDFKGKAILFTSRIDPNNPNSERIAGTVIDGFVNPDDAEEGVQQIKSQRAFHLHSGEGRNTIIRGLTIRNATFIGDGELGSTGEGRNGFVPGITVDITIDDNTQAEFWFDYANSGESVSGDGFGGAILCGSYISVNGGPAIIKTGETEYASPTIEYCVFENNTVTGARGGDGFDGVWASWVNPADPTDPINVFEDGQWGGHGGHGDGRGFGGAVACLNGSRPVFRHCTFKNNISRGGMGGNGGVGGSAVDGAGDPTGVMGQGGDPGDAGAVTNPFAPAGYGLPGVIGIGSDSFGGVVYSDGNVNRFGLPSSLEFENCTFVSNAASEGVSGLAGADGDGDDLDEDARQHGREGERFIQEVIAGGVIYVDGIYDPNKTDVDGPTIEIVESDFTENRSYFTYRPEDIFGNVDPFALRLENYLYGGAIGCRDNVTLNISDTTFEDNLGGAIKCLDRCSITISDSVFMGNESPNDNGGAICLDERSEKIEITNSSFSANTSGLNGGALFYRDVAGGDMKALITNCSFAGNSSGQFTIGGAYISDGFGGAVCNGDLDDDSGLDDEPGDIVTTIFDRCNFQSNTGYKGGAVYIWKFRDVYFTGCYVMNNRAFSGGGLYLVDGDFIFNGGRIGLNRATEKWGVGGGIVGQQVEAEIYSTSFEENSVDGSNGYGGAISFFLADAAAGAPPEPVHKIVNCLFADNSSTSRGGAISCESVAPSIEVCTFANNISQGGGAVYLDFNFSTLRDARIVDSIFAGNEGIAIYEESVEDDLTVINSMFYDNPDGDYYNGMLPFDDNVFTGETELSAPAVGFISPFEADPELISDPNGRGDYYLSINSAAFDKGSLDTSIFALLGDYPDPNITFGELTTTPEGSGDSGAMDLGYHRNIGLSASFVLTIDIIAGSGNVVADPDLDWYYPGQQVTLTAVPAGNYRIKRWTGGTLFDNTPAVINYVIMSENIDVKIEFESVRVLNVGYENGPFDYPSIPLAIDAAEDYDIIVVAPGIWQAPPGNAAVIIVNKKITIMSTDPTNPEVVANTIVDGTRGTNAEFSRFGFLFGSATDSDTVLDGLTIRNCGGGGGVGVDGDREAGRPDGSGGFIMQGAAIYIAINGGPTIKNCVITDNVLWGAHGGDGADASDDPVENAGLGGWPGGAHGAGIYCGENSTPTFINCQITDNEVAGGDGGNGGDDVVPGGTANYGGGYSSPDHLFIDSFSSAIFVVEEVLWEYYGSLPIPQYGFVDDATYYTGIGGGAFCDKGSTVIFEDCTITDNRAYGGIVGEGGYIGGGVAQREPFDEYKLPAWGGGVYCGDNSNVSFVNCDISNNLADRIGYRFGRETRVVTDEVFNRRSPYVSFGGGVAAENGADVTFDNCTISGNEAAVGGGIYWADGASVEITNSTINENTAYSGAGLHAANSLVKLSRVVSSTITDNIGTVAPVDYLAPNGTIVDVSGENNIGIGGGLTAKSMKIHVIDSQFSGNDVSGSGGAIYFGTSEQKEGEFTMRLVNSLVTNNTAAIEGGGLTAQLFSQPLILNCTFADNTVPTVTGNSGGGIYVGLDSVATIINSILWGNYADSGSQIAVASGAYFAEATVVHSDVQGGESQVDTGGFDEHLTWETDAGNIENDPLFFTGSLGNYYLSNSRAGQDANSPCIDAGSIGADSICFKNADGDNVCLDEYTTRTDSVFDVDFVDMGYHYSVSEVGPEPEPEPDYDLTVAIIGGHGLFSIVSEKDGIETIDENEYMGEETFTFTRGTVVTITAIRDEGYRVASWTEDTIEAQGFDFTYQVEMFFDKQVVLQFQTNDTITVPGDYTNIQTAIDAAQPGDIVKVSQGVFYGGNIVIDKAITLTSSNPDDPGIVANTIIDGVSGYASNRGVIFYPGAGSESVLNGFTIRNFSYFVITPDDADGTGEDGSDGGLALGGGIICLPGSSPTIKNCVVTGCDILGGNGSAGAQGDDTIQYNGRGGWGGAAWGAGIYVGGTELYQYIIRGRRPAFLPSDILERIGPDDVSSPTIINCTVINNSVTGGDGANGAGFFRIDDTSSYIDPGYGGLWSNDNEESYPSGSWESMGMIGNYRYYSGYGGGVFCGNGSKPTFTHCLITQNETLGGMSGLGGDNDGFVRQEPVFNYEVPSYGGGVYCGVGSQVEFIDCTITDNVSPKYTEYGAGDELAEDAPLANNEVGEPRYHVDPYLGHGGGVALDHAASVRFENCYIRNNEAAVGGGIYWGYEPSSGLTGTIEIVDCNIVDNLAYLGAGVFGNHGEAEITGNLITGNFAGANVDDIDNPDMGGQGGGIHLDASQGIISDCQIIDNEATSSGGGIFSTGSSGGDLETVNCMVVGNEAGRDGGGISLNWYSSSFIENCTIADNIASGNFSGDSFGGGLSTAYGSNAVVTNSIFWSNFALFGEQIIVATDFEFDLRPSAMELSYSNVQDNWTGIHVGTGCTLTFVGPDPNDFYGTNMDDDPQFVDGYYLSQPPNQFGTSPCVDAGDPNASDICFQGLYGSICLDDYTTNTNPGDLDTGTVDMGYHYPLPIPRPQTQLDSCEVCDFVFNGIVDFSDFLVFFEPQPGEPNDPWWLNDTCAGPPYCGGTDLSGDGIVNLVDIGLFSTCWLVSDANSPNPDPSMWALGGEPKGSGQTSIEMWAETATDNWVGGVEYNFINQGGGCNTSGWQSDPCYVDTGLSPGQYCTYYVITRDALGNETESSEAVGTFVGNDTVAPSPDPSVWLAQPWSDPCTPTTITMEAGIADDPMPFGSNPVWYFFECTDVDDAGPDDTFDSGWQVGVDSNIYSRDDYVAGSVYTFTVKTRDSSMNQNETVPSIEATVTAGIGRDTLPPDPDPIVPARQNPVMTWAIPPVSAQIPPLVGSYYNVMTASTAIDPAPAGYDGDYDVEYFFECLEDSGKNSGWIPINPGTGTAYYAAQVGDQFDVYRFRVRARDTSPLNNTTGWSCYCYAGDNPASCGCLGP